MDFVIDAEWFKVEGKQMVNEILAKFTKDELIMFKMYCISIINQAYIAGSNLYIELRLSRLYDLFDAIFREYNKEDLRRLYAFLHFIKANYYTFIIITNDNINDKYDLVYDYSRYKDLTYLTQIYLMDLIINCDDYNMDRFINSLDIFIKKIISLDDEEQFKMEI